MIFVEIMLTNGIIESERVCVDDDDDDDDDAALFQSLLYEACGRTVDPVYGAVGLLWAGKWHLCQEAVQRVVLTTGGINPPSTHHSSSSSSNLYPWKRPFIGESWRYWK